MELKPCPFCGGEADIENIGIMWSNWRIGCRTMGCCGSWADHGYVTEFAAAEAWNTRAERTCHNTEQGCKELRTGMPVFFCSECGEMYLIDSRAYFCPSCGAKVVVE